LGFGEEILGPVFRRVGLKGSLASGYRAGGRGGSEELEKNIVVTSVC
jgi:hypothetical protein